MASYTSLMRTTLTVDDDLIGILKARARQRGVPFKTIVNEAIRAGLGVASQRVSPAPEVVPHSFGFKPGIDTEKLGQLADELEAEAFAESMRRQIGR